MKKDQTMLVGRGMNKQARFSFQGWDNHVEVIV